MNIQILDGTLHVTGKVDSSNAAQLEAAVKDVMQAHPGEALVVDADELSYISSAGLRVLLMAARGAKAPVTVKNASSEVYDILEMTGFTEILRVERKKREISVEGCKIIGRGAFGTVYRIDDDTIVKVYETVDALPMIENEQKRAKQAFLKGIPTAISYDVVRVGEHYGSVFELLKAQTLNDLFISAPERRDELTRQYADIVQTVHGTLAEPDELPSCRRQFLDYIDFLSPRLPEGLAERLCALVSAVPEELGIVHGDFHMKNVMLSNGEPMLIDLDTLGAGNPVFDFAGIFVAYIGYNEDEPDNSLNFFGIPRETAQKLVDDLLEICYDGISSAALREIKTKIAIAGYLRFLYLLTAFPADDAALRDIRVKHSIERLQELTPLVDSLAI